jgi:hypothetical protein
MPMALLLASSDMIRIELTQGPAKARELASALIERVLPPGNSLPAAVVLRLARDAGISRSSLLRAKARKQIVSNRARGRRGAWTWCHLATVPTKTA